MNDFTPLQPAEQILLACCRLGTIAKIGPDTPEEPSSGNVVRAGFLRFLVLGGDAAAPVHECGVRLEGAYIQGGLNLNSTIVPVLLSIHCCYLQHTTTLRDAKFAHSVIFQGSTINGMDARRVQVEGFFSLNTVSSYGLVDLDYAHVKGQINFSGSTMDGANHSALSAEGILCGGDIHLTDGFVGNGKLSFAGAQIEGQLNCAHASFTASEDWALLADGIIVRGSVYLSDGFSASGCVRFVGARIRGELRCSGGEFGGSIDDVLRMDDAVISESVSLDCGFKASGRVNLQNVQVGGDLVINDAKCIDTLDADRINIKGALIFRGLENPSESVSFAGGRAGSLDDDKSSWGKALDLNGFVYGFINVHSEMSIADRLEWLDKQDTPVSEAHGAKEFRPQPWRHLQRVLDEMGHAEEARQVGIEFEKRLRAAGLIGQSPKRWNPLRRWFYKKLMTFLHVMYGFLTGYGYRPMLLLRSFVVVWLMCSGIYWLAANEGAIFAPSDPLVFQNEKYASCVPPASPLVQEPTGTGNWYLCAELPEAYTGFSPLAFSLDLLLPLVDLHQEKDWAPLIETPKANIFAELWGFLSAKRLVRFVMWVEILAGWGFSLLFVAVVSGLARRKE